MIIDKPINNKVKERANILYKLFIRGGCYTKKQLCESLGWVYNSNNDRRVREIIAMLATVRPIIATSDRKGYTLASNKEEVKHQINEINSRIEELQKRLPPLYDCLKK